MKTQELFRTTPLIVALVPVLGSGTRIALENMGPNFSVGWTARPTDNIAVYRRYSSVCAIRIGVQSQARPPWPSVPKISLTGTSSAARPGLRLRDTGLYHLSQAHVSVPSVLGTSVSGIRRGLRLRGPPSRPSVSGTTVCTIPFGFPSRGHPIRPSVSETSVCTIRLGVPAWPSVSSPSVLAIRLGDIRRGLQSQDQTIYFNHH